nr:hypothetical protein CFP56_55938 [Quercus suber]
MADVEPTPQSLAVVEATLADIDSLSTIVPRAFHNKNSYIRQCFPDTPTMRRWWSREFVAALHNSDTHLLTVRDDKSSRMHGSPTVGVLVCRLMGAQETGAGFFDFVPVDASDDHDRDMYENMKQVQVTHRERLMLGSRHFCIELFGVDEAYQGTGVGRRLLERACELADEAGLKSFVLANSYAHSFYERQGFEVDEVVVLPGEQGYKEYLLVRMPRKKG